MLFISLISRHAFCLRCRAAAAAADAEIRRDAVDIAQIFYAAASAMPRRYGCARAQRAAQMRMRCKRCRVERDERYFPHA